MKIKGSIPQKIVAKAIEILKAFFEKRIHAKKHNSGKCVSLDVGQRYRLLRLIGSDDWILMSHEDYNHKLKGC